MTVAVLRQPFHGREVSRHEPPQTWLSAGLSEAASLVRAANQAFEEHFQVRSRARDRSDGIVSRLVDLYGQIQESGEDADGFFRSNRFRELVGILRSLPEGLEMPDLTLDAAGNVHMEWYRSPRQVFVAKIKGSGTLYYARIDADGSRSNGSAPLVYGLPRKIAREVARTINA